MRILPTTIDGPVVVEAEPVGDARGFFARTFDRALFVAHGLNPEVEQCGMSHNRLAGTVRGMHLQVAPHLETKLVRCVRGAIVDVVVDLRPDSPTRLQHVAVELTADNHRALYVPPLFAHGFQTLTDETEVVYQISGSYAPEAERGLHHADPALGIEWPLPVSVVSDKDASLPRLADSPVDLVTAAGPPGTAWPPRP